MDCPRCGASAVTTSECPACGVLVAKARPSRPRPEPQQPEGPHPPAWRSLVLPGIGLALLFVAAGIQLRQVPGNSEDRRTRPARTDARATSPRSAPGVGLAAPQLPPPVREAPPALPLGPATDPAAEADQATASALAARLKARAPMSSTDVRAAEDLFTRHPVAARDLLEAVLLGAASDELAARRFDTAATLAERAASVAPHSPHPRRALLDIRLGSGDWPAAEQAGRALLAFAPDDDAGARGVAYALVRQDRSREALELLTGFLDRHEDAETRAFLGRVQHDQAAEKSLDEARLAHFHVRYDGEAHEDVGREILRLLERHYATLARTFDYQPTQPIPVILLSSESYYDSTGAPAWSGGQYDTFDGRVRIPIGGLSAALSPELDGTLLHELTHSFVADLSGGLAPRPLQEGLAQYVEGRRMSQLDARRLRALADGRLSGVSAFYLGSLWLVEDLMGQRGPGGINDLLRAMSAAGNADQAFQQVYGSDLKTLQQQARGRLRQRHGT